MGKYLTECAKVIIDCGINLRLIYCHTGDGSAKSRSVVEKISENRKER